MFSQTPATDPVETDNLLDGEYTADEISAYYLELDQVLDRIEHAANHYQILDLDRLATTGEIKLAYLRAVALLNPAQLGINLMVPETMLARIDPAFERVSRAYSSLVNFARRMEYDNSLGVRTTGPLRVDTGKLPSITESSEGVTKIAKPRVAQAPAINRGSSVRTGPRPAAQPAPAKQRGENRRRNERFMLSVPVHVTGYDRKGGRWHEATRTVDVSRTGALLNMRKRIKKGSVLYLTMPLPVRLRTRDFQEPTYVSYALVRRVEAPKGHVTAIGVEFLGPHPPCGYLERPWDVFKPEQWSGGDRRRAPRQEKTEPVLIEYFTDAMTCLKQETAETENTSRGGMRVMVKAAPAEFAMIRVNSVGRGFRSFAAVCDRFSGKDGNERLCLHFLESEWPG